MQSKASRFESNDCDSCSQPNSAKRGQLTGTRRVARREHLNTIALMGMNSKTATAQTHRNKLALTDIRRRAVELLSVLLTDVTNELGVAARDAGISDASFVRLRRALDRMACAQSVLESMRTDGTAAGIDCSAAGLRMSEAVGLLAKEWPEEYPAGAVERLIAGGD